MGDGVAQPARPQRFADRLSHARDERGLLWAEGGTPIGPRQAEEAPRRGRGPGHRPQLVVIAHGGEELAPTGATGRLAARDLMEGGCWARGAGEVTPQHRVLDGELPFPVRDALAGLDVLHPRR